MKHNAINLSHGTPGLDAPDFLIENLKHAISSGEN
jgi:aspartate/methionine/tyrosine aminotransferase